MALLVAHDHDRTTPEPRQTAKDGFVVAKIPVAGQRLVIGQQHVGEAEELRTIRMARDLTLLPGIKIAVDLRQALLGLLAQFFQLSAHAAFTVRADEAAQFSDFCFKVFDRLFKFQSHSG